MALLLAACLIPRVVAAWNWDILWGDSLHYRFASLALEQGNLEQGFAEFGLNIYPLILIPLRHLGIDWQITGKYFGVLVATCTVLPLWGWLRRMFDDRLALIACLIYALHGKLIAISPLIIRDSTFWFLLTLVFYYAWRAVGELRIRFFLAAGAALTLAVHTRTEGWLLLIPILGWGACRPPRPWVHGAREKGRRARLAFGTLLCLAMIPAAVAAVNLTWLRASPRWEFLRTWHLQMGIEWWNSASGMHVPTPHVDAVTPAPSPASPTPPPGQAERDKRGEQGAGSPTGPPTLLSVQVERERAHSPGTSKAISPAEKPGGKASPPFASLRMPAPVPPEQSMPGWILAFKLLERLAKGFTWVGSFLLLVGLACGWRIFLRPEHLTLFCMNLLLLVISRIRYWAAGLDLRYFMPMVIVAVPWMALGLQHVIAAARRLFARRGELGAPGTPGRRAFRILSGCLIAIALASSLLDGPMSAAAYMRKHAALGRWISEHAGPAPALAGNFNHLALETFYSNGHVVSPLMHGDCLLVPMPAAIAEREADVLVLWNEENIAPEYLAAIEERITYCGYRRVDAQELPAGENEVMVFLKGE